MDEDGDAAKATSLHCSLPLSLSLSLTAKLGRVLVRFGEYLCVVCATSVGRCSQGTNTKFTRPEDQTDKNTDGTHIQAAAAAAPPTTSDSDGGSACLP